MTNPIIVSAPSALADAGNPLVLTAAELKLRQQLAYRALNPQVEAIKNSPIVKVAVGAAVAGLFLAGRWGMAASLAASWFGSKPLAHVAAAGVAAVGAIDDRLRAVALPPEVLVVPVQAGEIPAAG